MTMARRNAAKPALKQQRKRPIVRDDGLLETLARMSAIAVVDRYAADVRDREGLIEAITRLTLIGREGHVQLYAERSGGVRQ